MNLLFLTGWGQDDSWGRVFGPDTKLLCLEDLDEISADSVDEKISSEEKFFLCGWSAGGMLALEYAKKFPKKVKALILFSTSPRFTSASDYSSGGKALGVRASELKLLSNSLKRDKLSTMLEFQKRVYFPHQNPEEDSVGRINSIECSSLQKGLQFLGEFDFRDSFSQISCPVLVLHGTDDQIISKHDGQYLAVSLPEAEFKLVEGGSHCLFSSNERIVVPEVEKFLSDVSSNA